MARIPVCPHSDHVKQDDKQKRVRVVLVDDSAIVRERVAELLATVSGIELVGQAPDIATGSMIIKDLAPDVVVLDISMPGGSGIELLKEIKQKKSSPVVIMFTTEDNAQLRRQCFQFGADYFFQKPTEFSMALEVCTQLGRMIARSTAEEAMHQNKRQPVGANRGGEQ